VSHRLLSTSTVKVEAQQLCEMSGCTMLFPKRKQSIYIYIYIYIYIILFFNFLFHFYLFIYFLKLWEEAK